MGLFGFFFLLDQKEAKNQGCTAWATCGKHSLKGPKLATLRQRTFLYARLFPPASRPFAEARDVQVHVSCAGNTEMLLNLNIPLYQDNGISRTFV